VSLAATSPPRLTAQPSLTGVAVGPLLKDLTGSDRLQGRGQVVVDVNAAGATVGAMTKSLAGSARLELRDGAVRGINLAQAIRRAKALTKGGSGSDGAGTGAKDEATDFSELTASLRIAGGVARNDDLAAKSPLLRVGGAGDIDLAASRLNYTVKATVVPTLEGQGGPELQALRGQTIPVKLSGPFDAIAWRIDFGAMAKEAAQAKIDEKKEALKEQARRRLGDKLRDVLKR
jgi:AsmA protein